VTVWEAMARQKPWSQATTHAEIIESLRSGLRLGKPAPAHMTPAAVDEIYDLLNECWKEDPQQRPTFSNIVGRLREVHDPRTPFESSEPADGDDNDDDRASDYVRVDSGAATPLTSSEYSKDTQPGDDTNPRGSQLSFTM
jgi:Protein tyrosine and serine/threonine kinase